MADDDFTLPVSGNSFSRLVRRTVQLGVDPEVFVPVVVQDVKTFYALDDSWTITATVVKKIRQDNGSGSWVVWYRVEGVIVNVHPFAGTGFVWTYFEAGNRLWDDVGGTDPAELSEGEDIRRWDMIQAPAPSFLSNLTPGEFFYSPVLNAINGKPVMYTRTENITAGVVLRDAANAPITANLALSGRSFTCMFVARRVGATNNIGITNVGGNRPFNLRSAAGGLVLFGFVTAFSQAVIGGWDNGDIKVITCRWNEALGRLQIRVNNSIWENSNPVGDMAWAPDAGEIAAMVNGSFDMACWGLYDGVYPDAALDALVAAQIAYYNL